MLPARLAGDVRRTVQAVRAVAPGRVTVALRATLAVALPLSAGVAAGRPELGAAASFGALAVLYVPQAPYRYRARVVRRVGLGLVAAVLLGSLAAGHGVVTALVAGLVAGTASFACQAAELPPPRELMLVMAVLAATDMPSDPAEAATRAGLAAAGALVAWLLTMAPALAGRWRAPEQAAVVAALGAVAGLLDAVGSAGAGAARHAAVTGVQRARAAVSQAALPPGHPLAGLVVAAEALLEAALHVEVEATAPLDPGWAAAVRALVPAVHGLPVGNVMLPETAAGTAGAGLLARALTDARAASVPPSAARTLPPWPTLHQQLAAGLRRHSVVLPSAARIGIAVAAGVALGQALGLGHAYWVGLTAAAVLQGSNLAVTRGRVLHRLAGTVAGVVLTFAVLGWNPPLWVVVLAVAAAQFAVELVIPVHYGLAVTAITVLALGLFHLGSPTEDVSSALGARLIDTAIGAALALVLRRVLWPRATVARLPQRQARVVAAVRAVFASAWSPDLRPRLPERRRMLQTELAALRVVHADALADAGGADAGWPVSAAAEELAFLALSLPPHRPEPPPTTVDAFLAHLDGLDAALSGSTRPPTLIPALPDHPRTAAAATALTAAVEVARG